MLAFMSQARTAGPPSIALYQQATRTVSTRANTKYPSPVDTMCPLSGVVVGAFEGMLSFEPKN